MPELRGSTGWDFATTSDTEQHGQPGLLPAPLSGPRQVERSAQPLVALDQVRLSAPEPACLLAVRLAPTPAMELRGLSSGATILPTSSACTPRAIRFPAFPRPTL